MTRKIVLVAALSVISMTAVGQSQLPKPPDAAKVERERAQKLEEYETYGWSRDQVAAANMANHIRIVNAIQAAMKDQGYRIDTIDPDVRIRYRLTLKERVQGNPTQQRSVWDNANSTIQIDFSREKLADFGVELIEADSSFLVWEAKGTYSLGTPDKSERQIGDAVTDIFKKYPSKD